MRNILIITLAALLFASCQKEIELDYKSVDKLYVIEGNLSNSTTEVRITQTRDMDQPANSGYIESAEVMIIDPHGNQNLLQYSDYGIYTPSSPLTSDMGEYRLEVSIGGETFFATSEIVDAAPELLSAEYRWVDPLFPNPNQSGKIVQYTTSIQDRAGVENYYKYEVWVNGNLVYFTIAEDSNRDGQVIEFSMETNSEVKFLDGDIMHTEIRSINRAVYDYLYSLILSDRTGSNPINYFNSNCLGYFSAHSTTTIDYIFNESDIQL